MYIYLINYLMIINLFNLLLYLDKYEDKYEYIDIMYLSKYVNKCKNMKTTVWQIWERQFLDFDENDRFEIFDENDRFEIFDTLQNDKTVVELLYTKMFQILTLSIYLYLW